MRFARILLIVLALLCLASFCSGPLMRPLYDRLVPSLAQRRAGPGSEGLRGVDGPVSRTIVHLLVLNGVGIDNLAGDVSLLLDKIGCVGQGIGNAPHDRYERSLLVNRRLTEDRAAELARDLGGVGIVREIDAAADEDAVLVLGADYRIVLDSLEGARGDIGR